MNEVQLFNFENHEVRSLLLNNEPWFVGKDVADVLGTKTVVEILTDTQMKKIGKTTKTVLLILQEG